MKRTIFRSIAMIAFAVASGLLVSTAGIGCAKKNCAPCQSAKNCAKGCDKPCCKKAEGKAPCPAGCDKPCCKKT